jgi:hypothetical protein
MPSSEEPQRSHPIASARLEDGTIVEMICRAAGTETAFLSSRDGEISDHKDCDIPRLGRVLPFSPSNNLLTHGVVLFPSTASEYEDEGVLLTHVRSFIHRYADVSDGFEELAALYVLLSWVFDRFAVVPYLRLKGDYGSGKSRCLQVIGSLCYKPMFVSGASTVSPMFRIIDAFRGTLILDESDFRFSDEKAEIVKILNNGNAAGFPVLRSEATPTKEFNPRAFDVFGPKIIATRRDFEDQALESRCITEVMSGLPPRADIPLSLPERFHTEALELRNRLLMYRFKDVQRKDGDDSLRHPLLEARVAQVYQPLLSLAPDEGMRNRLLALARKQTGSLRSERGVSIEAQLLDTLCVMRREGAPLFVRDITERFAARFGVDFDRPVNARWIGAQLRKRLSLLTVKSHGNYLVPDTEEQKLEILFARYQTRDDPVDVGTSGTF